jgi:hypothetical protein
MRVGDGDVAEVDRARVKGEEWVRRKQIVVPGKDWVRVDLNNLEAEDRRYAEDGWLARQSGDSGRSGATAAEQGKQASNFAE